MSLAAATLPCSSCHAPVDPLRAPRVGHFDEHFCYFCSPECAARYRSGEPARAEARPLRAVETTAEPLPSFDNPDWAREPVAPTTPEPSPARTSAVELTTRSDAPNAPSEPAAPPELEDPALSVDAGTLLLSLSVLGAILSLVLSLTGSSELSLAARLVVAAVATAALVAECAMGHRSVTELHPLATLCGPVVAVAAAIGLRLSEQPEAESAIALSGLVTLCAACSLLLVRRARRPLELERLQLLGALDHAGRRIVAGGEVEGTSAADLRPGEEIVVEAGDVLPVDATVTAGSARVLP
ncbi:MAG TPA: hypothetical protein VEQ59_07115, partial [Polyangiaceae bacterium]|nr:hypothetical protein [Polyangiaceae bacterium]